MINIFVFDVIQTSCFFFLQKVAKADFYKQSSWPISSAVSAYWNPRCILHCTFLDKYSNKNIIALSKACELCDISNFFKSSFVLSLHITVYQANNSMTTNEVDWLTLIHAGGVENFSKSISIRRSCTFSYPFQPLRRIISISLPLAVVLALMLVGQSKWIKLIIVIKHTQVKKPNW